MNTLKFCKVRKVKSPNRAHPFDAGIDFFVPEDIDVNTFASKCDVTGCHPNYDLDDHGNIKSIHLKSSESVLMPSGIKVDVPENFMLQFVNKSGISSKKHLIVGASVVDTGYQGECHINLHNVGSETVTLTAGDKIVQGILIPVVCAIPEEFENEKSLYEGVESARNTGGFGSTGN